MAQIADTPEKFVVKSIIFAIIFSINLTVIMFIILLKSGMLYLILPIFIFSIIFFTILMIQLPRINIARIKVEIEADIDVPSRMLLTMLESGNSIMSALERVSYTNAKSSKYFGKIATEVYLGKSLSEAIDEAIRYTPSESFRRILQPIRKSILTGTDIQKSLLEVLDDMKQEKAIEIERYEKKLSAVSLFYMIFGIIMPAIMVVIIVIIMSVIGLEVTFFPFLFIIMILLIIIQVGFVRLFQKIRPVMRL